MYWDLTPNYIQRKEHKSMSDRFDESVAYKIGPLAYPDNVEDLGIKYNLNYDFYDDDTNNNGILDPPDEE